MTCSPASIRVHGSVDPHGVDTWLLQQKRPAGREPAGHIDVRECKSGPITTGLLSSYCTTRLGTFARLGQQKCCTLDGLGFRLALHECDTDDVLCGGLAVTATCPAYGQTRLACQRRWRQSQTGLCRDRVG
ncbi:MAG: hypothetical protein JWO42_2832 [Chloroflexi bacterium]|nr:hypothetical protein [Chloroflexota bacterium]